MATQEKKEILPQKEAEVPAIEIVQPAIEKLIYVIRDKQVIYGKSSVCLLGKKFPLLSTVYC